MQEYHSRGMSLRRNWLFSKLKASWPSWLLIPRSWKIAPSHFRATKRVYTIGENDWQDVRKIRVLNEPAIFRREDSLGFPGPLTNLLVGKKDCLVCIPRLVRRLCKTLPELPSHVRDITVCIISLGCLYKNKKDIISVPILITWSS